MPVEGSLEVKRLPPKECAEEAAKLGIAGCAGAQEETAVCANEFVDRTHRWIGSRGRSWRARVKCRGGSPF